jgi:hypothetical protein
LYEIVELKEHSDEYRWTEFVAVYYSWQCFRRRLFGSSKFMSLVRSWFGLINEIMATDIQTFILLVGVASWRSAEETGCMLRQCIVSRNFNSLPLLRASGNIQLTIHDYLRLSEFE